MNYELMLKTFRNGDSIALRKVPEVELEEFLRALVELTGLGWRIAAYFGLPDQGGVALYCVLSGGNQQLGAFCSRVVDSLPSITGACPEAHLFEREIAEQCALTLDGHPWCKPLRYQPPLPPVRDAREREAGQVVPGVADFYRVTGSEISTLR